MTLSSLKQSVPKQFIKQNEIKDQNGFVRVFTWIDTANELTANTVKFMFQQPMLTTITIDTNAFLSQIKKKKPEPSIARSWDGQSMGLSTSSTITDPNEFRNNKL